MKECKPIEIIESSSGGLPRGAARVDSLECSSDSFDSAETPTASRVEWTRESRRRRITVRRTTGRVTIVVPEGVQVIFYVTLLVLILAMLVEIFSRH